MPVLAIDQGTTSTRALLLDESGTSRIANVMTHQQYYPNTGWVEHDPEELIRHIQLCIDGCSDVSAIGIDNQGESCLAWDADSKQAISPVIVWQDNRAQDTIDQMHAEGIQDVVMEKTGLPLDSYFSASKFAWILEHIPAAKTLHQCGNLRLGTTDAFFLDRLADRFVTDITTASRTSLLNLKSGQWDPDLCELFGVPMDALPEIVATTGDFGAIRSNGKLIPVTASIVDQQASLYGHGCRHPGDAKITFGTGAFALVLTGDQPRRSPEQGLLPTVAWQLANQAPTYALDGGVYCAGSAINWARSLGLFESFAQINQFAPESPSTPTRAIDRNLVFVPALSGLACPHWDRRAAGLWIGLSLDTGPMDLIQAVLEGIAFRAAEVINAMNDFAPIGNTISIDGGVSVNPYFCQFLANVLNRQVMVQPGVELTALGTARLAAGSSLYETSVGQLRLKYEPRTNMERHLTRFAEAIRRSSNWTA